MLDPSAQQIIAVGGPGLVALYLVLKFKPWQGATQGVARAGEVSEMREDLSRIKQDVAIIRTELLGMNGSGGGLKGEVDSLRKWRHHDFHNEIHAAIIPLEIRIDRLENKH